MEREQGPRPDGVEKRVDTFLRLNGFDVQSDQSTAIATWFALAAGTLSEPDLAIWLRARIRPLG